MPIHFEKFENSLKHLELQFENYLALQKRDELTKIDREAIRESVIQRFEICFDSMWKLTKRYLSQISGFPDLPASPKPLLRIACDNGLFRDVEKLLKYADARVATSHDYSDIKVSEAINLVDDFIQDAIGFYETISGKKWK